MTKGGIAGIIGIEGVGMARPVKLNNDERRSAITYLHLLDYDAEYAKVWCDRHSGESATKRFGKWIDGRPTDIKGVEEHWASLNALYIYNKYLFSATKDKGYIKEIARLANSLSKASDALCAMEENEREVDMNIKGVSA